MNPTLLLAIPMLPLLAAIIAGFFGKAIGRAGAHSVTIAGVAAFGRVVADHCVRLSNSYSIIALDPAKH